MRFSFIYKFDIDDIVILFILALIVASIIFPILCKLKNSLIFKKFQIPFIELILKHRREFQIAFFIPLLLTLAGIIYFDIHLKILLIFTLLNLIFRENFPFSNYPMYATFRPGSSYIFVTNEKEEPIPIRKSFGIGAATLQKIYMSKAATIALSKGTDIWSLNPQDLKLAGEYALNFLKELPPKIDIQRDSKSLRLYHAKIDMKNKRINTKKQFIAELDLC